MACPYAYAYNERKCTSVERQGSSSRQHNISNRARKQGQQQSDDQQAQQALNQLLMQWCTDSSEAHRVQSRLNAKVEERLVEWVPASNQLPKQALLHECMALQESGSPTDLCRMRDGSAKRGVPGPAARSSRGNTFPTVLCVADVKMPNLKCSCIQLTKLMRLMNQWYDIATNLQPPQMVDAWPHQRLA
ncbi:MAG: hypothetical protein FRX49_00153 [Trebouxia sp. A1-2]|nr:MAG: hypothetical protein FRX49_00153 [Trebouxia sp. A1-2]